MEQTRYILPPYGYEVQRDTDANGELVVRFIIMDGPIVPPGVLAPSQRIVIEVHGQKDAQEIGRQFLAPSVVPASQMPPNGAAQ